MALDQNKIEVYLELENSNYLNSLEEIKKTSESAGSALGKGVEDGNKSLKESKKNLKDNLDYLIEIGNSALDLADALGYASKETEALQTALDTAANVGSNLLEGDILGAIVSGVSGVVKGVSDWISGTEEEEDAMEEVNEELEGAERKQADIFRWVKQTAELLEKDTHRLSRKYELQKKIAEMTGEGIDATEQASLDETAFETLEAYEEELHRLQTEMNSIEWQLENPNPEYYAPGQTMLPGSDEELLEVIHELELEILETEAERLEFQEAITAEMEKQNRLTEAQQRIVDDLQRQIEVGLLDVENVLDIGGIQSQLVGAGVTGLLGAETLQGLGVTGSNYSNAVNIGTIQQTIYEAGPEYAAQSAAGAITNAMGG